MNVRICKTVNERRELIEKELGVNLSHTGRYSLDETVASTRHCENMIGVTQVPLGIAGPLCIATHNSQLATRNHYIPLATTEGALVASVNRGCLAITQSNGAYVSSYHVGTTRGPVFKVQTSEENLRLFTFLESHKKEMKKIAESTSHHLTLISYDMKSTGLFQFVRFVYDTKDAMGLNMVTIATDEIVRFIEQETGAQCVSLSGNYCVDKKASHLNFQLNRGFEVWADVVIPASIVATTLKTTPYTFVTTWLSKCMVGSAMAGSLGFNAQFANVLAALFIACGQDPAHVAECAIGMTTAEVTQAGELFVSIYLPDLMVGTVGGGTGLATQKEALELLGVAGGNDGKNSQKFAEIVGAAVLAGEISLLASLSEGTLAKAHQALARGQGKLLKRKLLVGN